MRRNGKTVACFCLLGLVGLVSTSYGADAVEPSEINQQMHRLQKQIEEGRKQYKSKPRTVYLNHRMENEYPYDDYLHVVRDRMQQVGIEHYASLGLDQLTAPASARVSITLNHDGTVTRVQFLGVSSDYTVESAVRTIVKLAQPFVPFPSQIKQKADNLVFTNTWNFVPGPKATKQ
jgi:protein TonB